MTSKKHLLNLVITGIALGVAENSVQAVAKYEKDEKGWKCTEMVDKDNKKKQLRKTSSIKNN